ncbi:MAG TPA: CvpA family protein [Cyclobacteriaceae bacterium]|nr:CvpA family protein [Cyclobacteriaceae bacterium]
MSKVDIAILIITLIGAWQGYKDGFLMGLITMLALVLGLFIAFKFTGEGMEFLQEEFHADKETLPYVTFFLIFVGVVILVTWLGKAMRKSIDKTFLGRVDEICGSLLGAFKTLFMISVALWIADSFKHSLSNDWTEGSVIYPFTAHLAPGLARWVAQFVPFLQEIFPSY